VRTSSWRPKILPLRVFECAVILFDLDGVLVDSTRSVDRQWRMWAKERNIDPERVLEIAHGVRTIEVVRKLARILTLPPKWSG